jgi:hypothetical protein
VKILGWSCGRSPHLWHRDCATIPSASSASTDREHHRNNAPAFSFLKVAISAGYGSVRDNGQATGNTTLQNVRSGPGLCADRRYLTLVGVDHLPNTSDQSSAGRNRRNPERVPAATSTRDASTAGHRSPRKFLQSTPPRCRIERTVTITSSSPSSQSHSPLSTAPGSATATATATAPPPRLSLQRQSIAADTTAIRSLDWDRS